MKGKLTLQQRLILPIVLLGVVTLLSNLLAVFSINNVHANAGTIVDEYMVSEAKLEDIRRSMMDIHRLALSHIVAADHTTMIRLVQEIKAEEAELDGKLADYESFVGREDETVYRALLEDYGAFKHALVYLVCASADSKTQEAYAMATGTSPPGAPPPSRAWTPSPPPSPPRRRRPGAVFSGYISSPWSPAPSRWPPALCWFGQLCGSSGNTSSPPSGTPWAPSRTAPSASAAWWATSGSGPALPAAAPGPSPA